MAKMLKPANPALFYRGTDEDPRLGDRILPVASPNDLRPPPSAGRQSVVVFLGHADDRGVVNGRGRAGAAQGPSELRRYLSRLTPGDRGQLDAIALRDLGNALHGQGDLAGARAALEEVSGRRAPEDVLEHIFARFCVGK